MTFQRSTALLLLLAFSFALPTCFPEGVATASSGANQQRGLPLGILRAFL
jgi:hypothetical protein